MEKNHLWPPTSFGLSPSLNERWCFFRSFLAAKPELWLSHWNSPCQLWAKLFGNYKSSHHCHQGLDDKSVSPLHQFPSTGHSHRKHTAGTAPETLSKAWWGRISNCSPIPSMVIVTKVKVKSLSRVRLFATLWTVGYKAPPFMGFSRQEYWSGLPFPSSGDLPDPGTEPGSPTLQADALTSEPQF